MNNYAYLLKFIVVGDSGVGKSCLVLNFTNNKVRTHHEVTIGVEFGVRTIECSKEKIKLQIWDTVHISRWLKLTLLLIKAGQETFKSLTRSYYRSACGALVVYDITKRDSYTNVVKWLGEIKEYGSDNLSLILIGNKSDLEKSRVVSTEEAEKFAKEHNMLFIETSALNSKNVENAFLKNTEQLYNKIKSGTIQITEETPGIKVGDQSQTRTLATPKNDIPEKKSCC